MAVTNFTPLLGLALPTTGDLSGTWGTTVNDAITDLLDDAVAGTVTLSANADVTLSTTNGADNQARNAVILWTASNGGTTRNITAPAQSKAYIVINAGTGSAVLRGAGPTAGVTIVSGERCLAAWNGSDFVKVSTSVADGVTSVGGTGTVNGITLTGTVTSTGNLTLGGTLANVGLTTQVTGTLPVANGGTSLATLTANNVIIGNGTSAPLFVAPGTSGNVLTSNGTGWTSAAAGASLFGDTDSASPFETSLGFEAGLNTTGTYNTFTGYQAGKANTSGSYNKAGGSEALKNNTGGSFNTALGATALFSNTTNSNNTAIGAESLYNNTAANNTAVGAQSLRFNTTATSNTAVGKSALELNTTGADNTAVGFSSLDANTTGTGNAALGSNALGNNTTGGSNTAFGQLCMDGNTVGSSNTAYGYFSLLSNISGGSNTAVGRSALQNSTVTNNTALGHNAGFSVSTGEQNTLIGQAAGASGTNNLTTGQNNIIIGYQAAASSATVSNEVTFGNASITKLRIPGLSVDWNADAVPFRNIPQNSQSAAYTLVASDSGRHIFHPVADNNARTFTIPANGSVPYPIGTAITFINMAVADVTIAITTDTLTLSPAGTAGSRTLATNGSATCIKITATQWLISGSGLT